MNDEPNCYAIRRVNPFLGVVEVVEIDGARALSLNGRQWQIEVEAERPLHTWGRGEPVGSERQFFRFGNWDAEQGLTRVPANPLLDIGAMLSASERMIAALRAVLPQLPFRFADRFEHWLLDIEGRPLALLATTVARRFTDEIRTTDWVATVPLSPAFTAASLDTLGVPDGDRHGNRHHAETLERQIRAAAGPTPHRCWYEREAGGGMPLDADCVPVPAEAFPELPLRAAWPAEQQTALVRDYLHWLAPRLLTLDTLSEAARRELERAACQQATLVADHFDLYPQVLHREMLDAARVEARLRRAAEG